MKKAQEQAQQQPQPDPQAQGGVKFSVSDNFFSIYSNHTEMGLTPWDIRINIGELVGAEGANAVVKRHGSIVMTPAHAKAFGDALRQTIAAYEQQFGVVDNSKAVALIQRTQ